MLNVSELNYENRLKINNINIKTKFLDSSKILERNSDNSKNDDVSHGIILSKTYMKDSSVLLIEKEFNPRIIYKFLKKDNLDEVITCPNCGNRGKQEDFLNGCKYCGTKYNIDYLDKNLGTKYHYDRIIRSNHYKVSTYIIDLIISMIISFTYFLNTGRTFTIFDIVKSTGFGILISLILFYVFYALDAFIVTIPVKIIKDMKNNKQRKFWEDMAKQSISKENVFNNFNSELKNFYFDDKNNQNSEVIDFDIIDYDEFSYFIDENKRINIKIKVYIREISYKNNGISGNTLNREFVLRKNEDYIDNSNNLQKVIKCHNCGASIDCTKQECEYCGSRINYLQEWYLVK